MIYAILWDKKETKRLRKLRQLGPNDVVALPDRYAVVNDVHCCHPAELHEGFLANSFNTRRQWEKITARIRKGHRGCYGLLAWSTEYTWSAPPVLYLLDVENVLFLGELLPFAKLLRVFNIGMTCNAAGGVTSVHLLDTRPRGALDAQEN